MQLMNRLKDRKIERSKDRKIERLSEHRVAYVQLRDRIISLLADEEIENELCCWREWALCTIRSHGTKLYILVSKLRSGTSKTKAGPGELVRVALFWKSHCATCSPVYIILYHVTGSCKGPILG